MLWGYVIPSNQDVVCNVMGMGGFQTDAADVVLKMGSGGAGGELRLHRFFLSPFLSFLLLISCHPS